MDPAIMREVDRLYGPLEWRLPEAHAIYWGHVGLKYSKKKDLITLRRVIYQSMQLAVLRGRLISTRSALLWTRSRQGRGRAMPL